MLKNRKNITDAMRNIKSILDKHETLKEDFVRLEGVEKYQQSLEFYSRVIAVTK